MNPHRLTREGRPELVAAPTRIVHLGLGAFFRAHVAWYTHAASDSGDWGIAAFTGRDSVLPLMLNEQEGLYTLTSRGSDGDSTEVVTSIASAFSGDDRAALNIAVASPEVTSVTLTVTEAAYRSGPNSVAPRLLDALSARRAADAGPITLVSCDNLPDNGSRLRHLLTSDASERDRGLAEWIDASVGFVSTVVDRITPRANAADVDSTAEAGWRDAVPVVTEPFSEWIINGAFASTRPAWETAGATFVDDLAPYSQRKLRLLNGAHSLLAYLGLLLRHETVAAAVADPVVQDALEKWWNAAGTTIDLAPGVVAAYVEALRARFSNARIAHRLDQIAIDGSQKLPLRVVPVAHALLESGTSPLAAVEPLAAWVAWLRTTTLDVRDVAAPDLELAARGAVADASRRCVALLDPSLAESSDFTRVVATRVSELERVARP